LQKSFFEKTVSVVAEVRSEVSNIYRKTKQKIEDKIEDTFAALVTEVHEKFRGGEPIPRADDQLVRLKEIKVKS